MIARVGIFENLSPEAEAASTHNLRERFLPALKAQEGFVGGYWLKGEDGKALSITLWESVAMVQEGGRRANAVPLLPGQTPEQIPSPQRVEIYEVVASA